MRTIVQSSLDHVVVQMPFHLPGGENKEGKERKQPDNQHFQSHKKISVDGVALRPAPGMLDSGAPYSLHQGSIAGSLRRRQKLAPRAKVIIPTTIPIIMPEPRPYFR